MGFQNRAFVRYEAVDLDACLFRDCIDLRPRSFLASGRHSVTDGLANGIRSWWHAERASDHFAELLPDDRAPREWDQAAQDRACDGRERRDDLTDVFPIHGYAAFAAA